MKTFQQSPPSANNASALPVPLDKPLLVSGGLLKTEVTLQSGPGYYKVIRKSDGKHLKTCKTVYVAELIEKHGLFFLESKNTKITHIERCALAEFYYKEFAKDFLVKSQQYEMAIKLNESRVTHRMARIHNDEMEHFVIFSGGLHVSVTPLHYRMFSIKPLFKQSAVAVQTVLL